MSDTLTPEKAQRMIASAPFIDPPTAAADVRDLALAYIDQEQTIAGLRARLDALEIVADKPYAQESEATRKQARLLTEAQISWAIDRVRQKDSLHKEVIDVEAICRSHELLRARLDAAEQEKTDLLRMNAELHEERQYLVSLRTRLDAAERQLEAFREYKAGVEAAIAEHVAGAKE